MRSLEPLELSKEERTKLEWVAERGERWRERQRAQTILYLADGWAVKDVAAKQKLNLDTVYDRRQHWLEQGFGYLPDHGEGGRPLKLTDEHRQMLREWASQEALSAAGLAAKLREACGLEVGAELIRRELKKMDFVWKRTRHSLKKTGSAALPGGWS